ncbi:MAG TPA: hypothetical protein VKB88_19990 [Bryobacteraceae bacterium]|nr:hypothetical protein [Bryobacteraceae bacterium]
MVFAKRALPIFLFSAAAWAQIDPKLYSALQWRNIGPFRGGRISAVGGAISQPGTFYAAAALGGVWMTVSAGATWFNVTDSVPEIANVTSIEVAPSDADVVYLGTGDRGRGIYKTINGGKTWERIGPTEHAISAILVDPHDPNLVLAAAEGDPRAKNDRRGVYRSTDGGRNWNRVLYKDDETGASSMVWAFDHPAVVYATLTRHYTEPGAGGRGGRGGRGGGGGTAEMYRSTDEGLTWSPVKWEGQPAVGALAVAQHTNSQRLYMLGRGGIYRSDDGAAHWALGTSTIYTASGHIYVDSKNPDVIYTVGTSAYKSEDGGKTLAAFKGAPGGDDPREWWLDPVNPDRILYGGDQGACVSFDGGHTWSSWYNQPTAQVYKIGVDNRFPYWVYGSQQDSGIVGTRSRGDLGEITPWDWFPVPGWEAGYVTPDPVNPHILYTNGNYGDLQRVEIDAWQQQIINPAVGHSIYRRASSAPIVFSPQDPHTMYWATQFVMRTTDEGRHFQAISPDLTARAGQEPATGPALGRGGAAITTLAVSTAKGGVMWTGSNNGVIQVTQDGGAHWKDVTPAAIPAGSLVESVEASHFDPAEAYVAVDRAGAGDDKPYVFRTRNYGKDWQLTVNGLPADEITGSFLHVVKEDMVRRGLLFAGSETTVHVSFDDGDHWQSMRLNLPTTSYRDLVVHGDDLVAGTYGRSFFVLDDLSPLRQLTPALISRLPGGVSYLFKPADALRVLRNINADTPLPPEVPHALNPPEGAILDYYLAAKPAGDVKIEIYDAQNHLVRTLSSNPAPPFNEPTPPVPSYWLRTAHKLTTDVGANRTNWDLRYDDPPALSHNWAQVMAAVYQDTPYTPQGIRALPGTYTLKLIVNGKTSTQMLTVKGDPRIGESAAVMAGMRAQFDLERKIADAMTASYVGYQQAADLRARLKELAARLAPADAAKAAAAVDAKAAPVEGNMSAAVSGPYGVSAYSGNPGFTGINGSLAGLFVIVEYLSDHAPVDAQEKAFQDYCGDLNRNLALWRTVNTAEVPVLNEALRKNNLPALKTVEAPGDVACGK